MPGISELGLPSVAGILPTAMVWRPGKAPLPPALRSGRGRPGTQLRRDETHQPVSAKAGLALELDTDAWQQITLAFSGASYGGTAATRR